MFCKNCGAKLADGSSFCSVCGAKQEFSDNIEIIPRDAKELTNEEIYQADLNKKKKRLIIVGIVMAVVSISVFGINNSIDAGQC